MWIHSKFRRRKFSLSFTGQKLIVYNMMLYGHEAPAIVCTACRSSIIVPTCIICASCAIKPTNSRNCWPKQIARSKGLRQPHQTSFCGQAVIRPALALKLLTALTSTWSALCLCPVGSNAQRAQSAHLSERPLRSWFPIGNM